MPFLKVKIDSTRKLRHGSEWFWSVLLEKTADGQTVTLKDLDGPSDPYQDSAIRDFLNRMTAAGYIERFEDGQQIRYRMIKRQRDCPIVSNDGKPSVIGNGRQNMWNVMRRTRGGFTIKELALAASTDDVTVSVANAKKYVLRLATAGLLRVVVKGKRGHTGHTYTLLGSANTGPKAPRVHSATVVYDPNRSVLVGDLMAEEDCA